MWLFAPLLVLPLIEIALFVLVGGWLTLLPTLALVVLAAFAGVGLIRWQGMRAVADLRRDMGQIRDPLSTAAHGALIVLAGVLLIIPGFFTDSLALILLVPAVRRALIGRLGARVQMQGFATRPQAQSEGRRPDANVIDGEFFEVEENPPPRGPSGWTRH